MTALPVIVVILQVSSERRPPFPTAILSVSVPTRTIIGNPIVLGLHHLRSTTEIGTPVVFYINDIVDGSRLLVGSPELGVLQHLPKLSYSRGIPFLSARRLFSQRIVDVDLLLFFDK